MSLDFVLENTCGLCGWRNRGRAFYSGCRVNKASIVTGVGMVWGGWPRCRECDHPNGDAYAVQRVVLTPDSEAKVLAFRQRKGWAVAA